MRAVSGMPLGEIKLTGSAMMLNCIGEMPDVSEVENLAGVSVHDYSKAARPGRKVGHITLTADRREDVEELLVHVQERLK